MAFLPSQQGGEESNFGGWPSESSRDNTSKGVDFEMPSERQGAPASSLAHVKKRRHTKSNRIRGYSKKFPSCIEQRAAPGARNRISANEPSPTGLNPRTPPAPSTRQSSYHGAFTFSIDPRTKNVLDGGSKERQSAQFSATGERTNREAPGHDGQSPASSPMELCTSSGGSSSRSSEEEDPDAMDICQTPPRARDSSSNTNPGTMTPSCHRLSSRPLFPSPLQLVLDAGTGESSQGHLHSRHNACEEPTANVSDRTKLARNAVRPFSKADQPESCQMRPRITPLGNHSSLSGKRRSVS